MIISNIWKSKKCSKPPTSSFLVIQTFQANQCHPYDWICLLTLGDTTRVDPIWVLLHLVFFRRFSDVFGVKPSQEYWSDQTITTFLNAEKCGAPAASAKDLHPRSTPCRAAWCSGVRCCASTTSGSAWKANSKRLSCSWRCSNDVTRLTRGDGGDGVI